jgi:hypothetical protein
LDADEPFRSAKANIVKIVIVDGHLTGELSAQFVDFLGILDVDCNEPLSE